jgi:hypothetical protein
LNRARYDGAAQAGVTACSVLVEALYVDMLGSVIGTEADSDSSESEAPGVVFTISVSGDSLLVSRIMDKDSIRRDRRLEREELSEHSKSAQLA